MGVGEAEEEEGKVPIWESEQYVDFIKRHFFKSGA